MELPHRIYRLAEVERLYRDLLAAEVASGGAAAVHAPTHLPSGSDPLTTAAAGAITPGDSAAEGSAESFARSDHKHSIAAFGTGAGEFCEGNDARLGGGFTAAYYYGYHDTGNITWTSTTWSGVHNILTFVDVDQVGITRSNSDFTVDDAGDYIVDYKAGAFKSGVPAHIGVRLLLNGSEVGQFSVATNNAAQLTTSQLHKRVPCAAGDVLTLEYCVTAAFGAFGVATLNGEATRVVNVEIYRVK